MSGATITIRTDNELAAKVAELATAMDRSRNWVIEDALRNYVEIQAWQIEGVHEAIRSMDAGEGIPHKEAMVQMEALLFGNDGTE